MPPVEKVLILYEVNGALWSKIIDAGLTLGKDVSGESINNLILGWDGSKASSYWGNWTGVTLWMKDNTKFIVQNRYDVGITRCRYRIPYKKYSRRNATI